MKDKAISVNCTVAYGAWIACLAIWAIGWAIDSAGLRSLSIITCGIAVTATVRTYFLEFKAQLRNAFELGRDSVTRLRKS